MSRIKLFALLVFLPSLVSAQNPEYSSTVFEKGEHGYRAFRLPSVLRLTDGTILAFAEARKNSLSDTGDIDMVVRHSYDGGRTWGR